MFNTIFKKKIFIKLRFIKAFDFKINEKLYERAK